MSHTPRCRTSSVSWPPATPSQHWKPRKGARGSSVAWLPSLLHPTSIVRGTCIVLLFWKEILLRHQARPFFVKRGSRQLSAWNFFLRKPSHSHSSHPSHRHLTPPAALVGIPSLGPSLSTSPSAPESHPRHPGRASQDPHVPASSPLFARESTAPRHESEPPPSRASGENCHPRLRSGQATTRNNQRDPCPCPCRLSRQPSLVARSLGMAGGQSIHDGIPSESQSSRPPRRPRPTKSVGCRPKHRD